MNERRLTCIVCPKGCDIGVRFDSEGNINEIFGYTCPRGKEYAIAECTAPVRTVTTTARCEDSIVVAVKTSKAVPKHLVFDVMKEINAIIVRNDCKIGDVIIKGVCGTDADVVVTSNR